MRLTMIVARVAAVAFPAALAAQSVTPPHASQNPSPMVEETRAHVRLAPRERGGARRTFTGPQGKPIEVWIPDGIGDAAHPDLVIHFHGAAWLAHEAVSRLPARETAAAGRVTLSGFSAGHGAIRAILREPRHFARVDAVLLLDGMHTSYIPERTVLAEGGLLDTRNLEAFVRFAEAAASGGKRIVVTHSEIFPGTFASTTETADYLLRELRPHRTSVLRWGPVGMQQLSEVHVGGFVLLGFAGNSAPDHIDHLHGMPEFLALLRVP